MLTEEEFITLIQNQFPEEMRDEILSKSIIRELKGWSSLQALIITVAIDEEIGVTLTDEDFRKAITLHDLYTIIEKKLLGK